MKLAESRKRNGSRNSNVSPEIIFHNCPFSKVYLSTFFSNRWQSCFYPVYVCYVNGSLKRMEVHETSADTVRTVEGVIVWHWPSKSVKWDRIRTRPEKVPGHDSHSNPSLTSVHCFDAQLFTHPSSTPMFLISWSAYYCRYVKY